MSEEKGTGSAAERIELIAEIEQTFEARPLPHPIAECDCPGCRDLTADFYGRQWLEIDDAKLEANKSLSFFAPKAFHYFLPAYLRYSLRHFNLDSAVCEFTVYALAPTGDLVKDPSRTAWMRERLICFDRKQAEVILRFLALVSQDEELSGFHYDIGEGISYLTGLLRDLKLLD